MECCGPGYASPADAIRAPREKILYTIAIYTGTGIQKPDYLCTIDADPDSPTYSKVIHRLEMPGIGDELHHMGWNACSSCFDDSSMSRSYLLVPGVRSSNIHIVDTATDPRAPRLHKVIEGSEIKARTDLSAPHTVHCLGSEIIISMLGNAKGEAPGGYLHLDKDFNIIGRWENSMGDIPFGYDFWYQPRHNVMASSEWAAPNTFMPGFDLEEVGHLKYGRRIHLWDFEKKEPKQTFYLGEDGLIPLEVRFHHDPDSTHGFCGAALSAIAVSGADAGGGAAPDRLATCAWIASAHARSSSGWPISVSSPLTTSVFDGRSSESSTVDPFAVKSSFHCTAPELTSRAVTTPPHATTTDAPRREEEVEEARTAAGAQGGLRRGARRHGAVGREPGTALGRRRK